MSHFAVLVIGNGVEAQLAPYHEYECTGRDDEYVVDVDVTEEVEACFNKSQKVVILSDGRHLSRWDRELYTLPPEHTWGNKRFALPIGASEIEMSAADARAHGIGVLTMTDAARWCCADKERDGRYYSHTNPNAKWDYWRLGGRWTGFFRLAPKAKGLVGKKAWDNEGAPPGYADQALKGDIDFAQKRNDAEAKARILWNTTRSITGGASWESWDDTRIRYPDIKTAREEYHAQPALEMLLASGNENFKWDINDDLSLDLERFIQTQRDKACVTFAFIRESQWTERRRMGWFGMSSDDMSEGQWNRMFNDMIDALPDETLLTVVDCHI